MAKPAQIAIIFLLLGIVLDQTTTRYGLSLSHPDIWEGNPSVQKWINLELWITVDIFIAVCLISVSYYMSKVGTFAGVQWYPWITCFIFGALRWIAGLLNIHTILSKIFI